MTTVPFDRPPSEPALAGPTAPAGPVATAAADPLAPAPASSRPLDSATLRSPWLIAATVILAGAIAAIQGSWPWAVLAALLVFVLVACTVTDLEYRLIPNRITGPAVVAAIILGTVFDPGGEPHRLVWAAASAGFLLLAALIYPAGMGMGDVKLLAVIGLCLGQAAVTALFLALLAQVVTALVLAVRHGARAARKTTLPFGPYLAGGALLAAVGSSGLLHAALHLAR
ncbi:MAG TPA: A24 family peptidase [Solirubrobacteraceae bacterium]|nr:A24 family peptidase [Solirubrobacteraceae bacterium]